MPAKQRQRCEKVKEALQMLEGVCDTKNELIDQYKEITSIAKDITAHKHIDEAVKCGYVFSEYYRPPNSKNKLVRYTLIKEDGNRE